MTGNELDFNFKRKKKNQKIISQENQDNLFFEEDFDGMEDDTFMD